MGKCVCLMRTRAASRAEDGDGIPNLHANNGEAPKKFPER